MKDLHDMAVCVFAKTTPDEDAVNKRKQANKEFSSNTNVSPLGRFLLSRYVRLMKMLIRGTIFLEIGI